MAANGKLTVGYNYPWPSNKFGVWIGPQDRQDRWPSNYAQIWKDLPFKKEITDNLKTLQDNGVEVIRWFLMGNGFNYGLPPRVTYAGTRDSGGAVKKVVRVDFDPPTQLDPLFLDHFQQLLEIHTTLKLKLIPSLISYQFFSTVESTSTTAGGRGSVAEDSTKRNTFLSTVLGEFLRVSDSYRELIHAWEVINEPAYDVRYLTPPQASALDRLPHLPFISKNNMVTFLSLALAWIKGKKYASTVGHRFASDLDSSTGMPPGDLHQFHYYAQTFGSSISLLDPNALPSSSSSGASAIGEFGSAVGEGYESGQHPPIADVGNPWKELKGADLDPANTVYERLSLIKTLGYDLALVWPDLNDHSDEVAANDLLKLSPLKLASLNRFVKSQ